VKTVLKEPIASIEVETAGWSAPFSDPGRRNTVQTGKPQRDSNPCRHLERAAWQIPSRHAVSLLLAFTEVGVAPVADDGAEVGARGTRCDGFVGWNVGRELARSAAVRVNHMPVVRWEITSSGFSVFPLPPPRWRTWVRGTAFRRTSSATEYDGDNGPDDPYVDDL
jgi:hypothetical protein